MYLLKLSLRPWREAPFSQLVTVFTVGFLLFLVVFLYWTEKGLDRVVSRLESEQVVTAYLGENVLPEDEAQIVDTIRQFVPDLEVSFIDNQIMNQLSYEVSRERFKQQGFNFAGDLYRGVSETIALLRKANSVTAL